MNASSIALNSGQVQQTGWGMFSRILGFPMRVFNKLRKLDGILAYGSSPEDLSSGRMSRLRAAEQAMPPVPGPWGFLTSGYFLGLFIMALLLNRIQNLVVPQSSSAALRRRINRRNPNARHTLLSLTAARFLPIDLSSTFPRLAFRIPSIYLLGKAVLLWVVVLLQSSDLYPSSKAGWLQTLDLWASRKTMDDISWFTFTSVCIALFIAALTNGIEGRNQTHNAPFNLFAYSFLLYLYTSPVMHPVEATPNHPSRPDKQVTVTLILPLFELLLIHTMEVRRRWARLRLVPTSIVGVISLVHFHLVLWVYPSSYPLPNYVPNIVETFFLSVTVLTLSLNALIQLLTSGNISKPLIGHTASLMPKWDEDFTVVIFRLGTASLEATSVAGLGNEVGGIAANPTTISPRSIDEDGAVELDRAGVSSLSPSSHGGHAKRGFANEITHVKVNSTHSEFWLDTVVNVAWRREITRFGVAAWKVSRGIWRVARGRAPVSPINEREDSLQPLEDDVAQEDEDVYDMFLRGEVPSDEEEDLEFDPASDSEDEDLSDATDEEENGEAVTLYADLSDTTSTSAPLLLAHMTDSSSSPLTRGRYSHLLTFPTQLRRRAPGDELAELVSERRLAKHSKMAPNSEEEASPRACVICTAEPRDIICWPCRCLAICDDCRQNMASRTSAFKHICPCCRRNVEGYSKIYIP